MILRKILRSIAVVALLGIAGCNLFNPTQSVDIASNDAAALTYEGYLHFQKTEYGMAREYFERAIHADSSYSEAWYGYAKAIASMQPGLNPFELVTLTKSTASSPFAGFKSMSDKEAKLLYDGIDSVMMVLDEFIQLDTTGHTDKHVRFSHFADSYSILCMAQAGIAARDEDLDLNDIMYIDENGIHIDFSRMGSSIQATQKFASAMTKLGKGLKADKEKTGAVLRTLMPDSSGDWLTNKAFADFTDHAANFMIDKGEQLEKIDVSRADVFYNYGNAIDDDGDGCIDEEVYDGFDNDGDGEIDEDARSQSVNVTDMSSIQYTTSIIYPPVKELKMVGIYENGAVDIDMNGKAGEDDPDEWTFKNKDYTVRFNNGDHLLKFAFKADFFSPYFMNLSPEERIEIKEAVRHDTDPNNIQYSLQQRQQLIGGCWNNYDETRFRLWIMSRNAL